MSLLIDPKLKGFQLIKEIREGKKRGMHFLLKSVEAGIFGGFVYSFLLLAFVAVSVTMKFYFRDFTELDSMSAEVVWLAFVLLLGTVFTLVILWMEWLSEVKEVVMNYSVRFRLIKEDNSYYMIQEVLCDKLFFSDKKPVKEENLEATRRHINELNMECISKVGDLEIIEHEGAKCFLAKNTNFIYSNEYGFPYKIIALNL